MTIFSRSPFCWLTPIEMTTFGRTSAPTLQGGLRRVSQLPNALRRASDRKRGLNPERPALRFQECRSEMEVPEHIQFQAESVAQPFHRAAVTQPATLHQDRQ